MKTAAALALMLFTAPACKQKDAAAPPPPVAGKGSAAPAPAPAPAPAKPATGAPLTGTFTSLGVVGEADGDLRDARLALRADGRPIVVGIRGNQARGYARTGTTWISLGDVGGSRAAALAATSADKVLALGGQAGAGGMGVGQVQGFQLADDGTAWNSVDAAMGPATMITSAVAAAPLGSSALVVADSNEGGLIWRAEVDGAPWTALPSPVAKARLSNNITLATSGERAVLAYQLNDKDNVPRAKVATWKTGEAAWRALPDLGALRTPVVLDVAATAGGATALLRNDQLTGCAVATTTGAAWTEIGLPDGAPTNCELRGFQLVGGAGNDLWLAWVPDAGGLGLARWDGTTWHVAGALAGAPTTKLTLTAAALGASGALTLAWHAGPMSQERVSVGTFAPTP